MKKGFTLIELLAVIVILAVIALIAVPIVLNIVEDSKKNSAKESAKLYVDGLNISITSKLMTSNTNFSQCFVTNGTLLCDGKIVDYEVNGQKPTSGYISYNNGVVSEYVLCIMNYKVSKVGNNTTIEKTNECTSGDQVLPTEEIDVYAGSGKSSSLTGCGTENDPYLITSANDLVYMRDQVNSSSNITTTSTCETSVQLANQAYYKQTVGIALNDTTNWKNWNENTTGLYEWEPIGKFQRIYNPDNNSIYNVFFGGYDGDNHTISGIYINTDDANTYYGFFGSISHIELKNLKVTKSYMKAPLLGGVVGGTNYDFCWYSQDYIDDDTINISNIYSASKLVAAKGAYDTVESQGITGGLVGGVIGTIGTYNYVNISDIYNASTIIVDGLMSNYEYGPDTPIAFYVDEGVTIGGIIGYIDGGVYNIKNLVNTTNIVCDSVWNQCGGILGTYGYTYDNSRLDSLRNTGNITCSTTLEESNSVCGGIASILEDDNWTNAQSTLVNAVNTGNITCTGGEGNECGGLIGNGGLAELTKSYNSGNVISDLAAGLVGRLTATTLISESYNTGNITGKSDAGGLAVYSNDYGEITLTINNSYNRGNVTGNGYAWAAVGGLVGETGNYNTINISNSYNTGNITASVSGISNFEYDDIVIMASGIALNANSISNTYNVGSVNNTGGTDLFYYYYYTSGIVGKANSVNNSYNTGLLTYSPYTDLGFDEYAVGPIIGLLDPEANIVVTNNKYLSSTSSTPGVCVWDIDEPYEYSGNGITAVSSINDMPSILSVVNGDGKFKSDDRNINGGYPLLKWQ